MSETCDKRHNWASQTMAGRAAIAASCWARRPWTKNFCNTFTLFTPREKKRSSDLFRRSLGIWRGSSGPDYPESAAEAPCHRTSILSVRRPVYSQSWSMAGFADLFRSTSFVMQAPQISWRLNWDDWGIAYIRSTTWFLSNLLKNLSFGSSSIRFHAFSFHLLALRLGHRALSSSQHTLLPGADRISDWIGQIAIY